jgi:hypothetical protein
MRASNHTFIFCVKRMFGMNPAQWCLEKSVALNYIVATSKARAVLLR